MAPANRRTIMKYRALLFLAPLALSGCAGLSALMTGVPASPAVAANKTVLDEQLLTGLELGYKGWRIGVELAVDMGRIKGAQATRIAEMDRRVYGALAVAEDAYKALNGTSYAAAIKSGQKALADGIALMETKP